MPALPPRLAVGHLELRRWTPATVDPLLAAVEASFPELHQWMSWAATMPTRQVQLGALHAAVDAFESDTEWSYSLHEGPSEEVVGAASLLRRVGPGGLEIGYWVRSDRTGRGYASASARALADTAFTYLGSVDRVEIHTDAANRASAGVARKLGYRLAGQVPADRLAPGQSGRMLVWVLERRSLAKPPSWPTECPRHLAP